jgi:predicted transcriptional regulator
MKDSEELLDFVKAMADVDRLRIIGILATERANQSEIAGHLNMPLRDVVDHLAFLEYVGILSPDCLFGMNRHKDSRLAKFFADREFCVTGHVLLNQLSDGMCRIMVQ